MGFNSGLKGLSRIKGSSKERYIFAFQTPWTITKESVSSEILAMKLRCFTRARFGETILLSHINKWGNVRFTITTITAVKKAINITYYEWVFVALSIQHAMRMRLIVICKLPDLRYFSTLSHKRHDFRKQVTEYKTRVLISSTNSVWNICHSEKNSARYDNKCMLMFVWSTFILVRI